MTFSASFCRLWDFLLENLKLKKKYFNDVHWNEYIVIKEIEIVFHISWFFRNEKGVDYMEIFIPGWNFISVYRVFAIICKFAIIWKISTWVKRYFNPDWNTIASNFSHFDTILLCYHLSRDFWIPWNFWILGNIL